MINAVTTNKTDFFREPVHFDYLVQTALPEFLHKTEGRRKLRVWSAGCATGEEPYTLAMILSEFAKKNSGFDFSILATDISTNALEKAKLGIYNLDRVEPVPSILKRNYFLKSKDRSRQLVRVIPQLRARVQFGKLNLMDNDFKLPGPMDIIFCRNVFIYFNQPTQNKILAQFFQNLAPGGHIFLGLTETGTKVNASLTRIASSIYKNQRR